MAGFTYPVPDNPPDEGDQITVAFGLEWQALILDAVDNLRSSALFADAPDDILGQIDQLLTLLMTDVTMPPQVFPKFGWHFHGASKVTAGNPIALTLTSNSLFNGYWSQNAPAQHDKFEFSLPLAAGQYTMYVLHTRSTAEGILEILFDDGASYTYFDGYGSVAYNQIFTATVTVDEDKDVLVRCEVNSKNASSSGFRALVAAFWFIPQ